MNTTVISKPHRLRRVFVWQLPVRVYHWLNALCILALIATGFYIGNPLAILSGKEASDLYIMGTVRFIHFVAAYIFFFNFAFRIYWGFVGNKYAGWKNFIPTNKQFFKDMWAIIETDIFMTKGSELHTIGHNRVAGFIYFLTFIAFGIQCLTGFGLYSATSDWWFPNLFAWVPAVVGGDFMLRQIHHWTMWFFILFTVVHVYLVFYHDYVEGRGEISSMGGGWKFIEEEIFEANKKVEEKKK
ncbi:MAG: Ni/Fe-hydrogenase, b-type cytochrome subunit [Cyclobacteriaceae bacterium]|nr:Ni/Fe-hydrogenase, b-type cytochrome subunit [Cyclobacteriaceae bacterium]UYN86853.1 MAG: Ni/Fe-hydrogenase, b-type cytochrome subunit [Cyclobacteriaceae bacterium]